MHVILGTEFSEIWHIPWALPLICSELVYVTLYSIVGMISVDVFPFLCPQS